MAKKRLLKPREERLMEFLWEQGEPLSVEDMRAKLEPEGWNFVTLDKAVRTLLSLEYLRVNGMERHNTQWARRFEPALTKDEYMALMLKERGVTEESIGNIVFALIGGDKRDKKGKKKDEKLIHELEDVIERIKSRK